MDRLQHWWRLVAIACAVAFWHGGSVAQSWLGVDAPRWKVECSEGGVKSLEIEFWHTVGGKPGSVMIKVPVGWQSGHMRWRISPPMWGSQVRVSWCEGANSWGCESAVAGELEATMQEETWIGGDLVVTLQSGKEMRANFRAQRVSEPQLACA